MTTRRTILTCTLALGAAAAALAGPPVYDLSWNSLDGGSASGIFALTGAGGLELSGSIGQADPGTLSGTDGFDVYTLEGGFWPGTFLGPCPADIVAIGGEVGPDGLYTLDDILAFIDAYNDASGCPGVAPCNIADLTGIGGTLEDPMAPDGLLTLDDILFFVDAYNAGCPTEPVP